MSGVGPGARVLVTGAGGFVGSALVPALVGAGFAVRRALRRGAPALAGIEDAAIGEIGPDTDWAAALAGCDAVVHLAALAHAGRQADPAACDRVNRDGTLALARAAERAGIARFVFLSSIRAQTGAWAGKVLTEADPPAPDEPYGRAKLAAETGLAGMALDSVALRPVLVVGPGARGNIAALLRLARLPIPLPLAGLDAPRSVLRLDSLTGAILWALTAERPGFGPWIAAEDEPVTLPEMIAALRAGLGRGPGLFRVPEPLLTWPLGLAGRGEDVERLARPLVASAAALKGQGWRPVGDPLSAFRELTARSRTAA